MSNAEQACTLSSTNSGNRILFKRFRCQWSISGSFSLWLLNGLNSVLLSATPPENLLLNATQPLRVSPAPDAAQFTIASADNFNPGLALPPPKPEDFKPIDAPGESLSQKVGLESLQTDFRNDQDNFGQHNRFIEETAQYRLSNGDQLHFKTGFHAFAQSGAKSVRNIPIQGGWEGKLGTFKLRAATGVDLYDRLPVTPYLDLEAETAILPNVTLTGVVEQEAYKFNAQTLNNRISAWRLGPNVYWQIDRHTSLFALYRWGSYSDGNTEQQSFSRLERKFGQFSLAANLFTWSYANQVEKQKGYFSPSDFLTYNGELAWEGQILEPIRCRLAAVLGRQRLNGAFSAGNSYQARCTVKVSPHVEADVGYSVSGIRSRGTSAEGYENQSVTGQLRFRF